MARTLRTQVYSRRRGRLTDAQARALNQLRERYCISSPGDVCGRVGITGPGEGLREGLGEGLREGLAPGLQEGLGIEIGFGMGAQLLEWAVQEPQQRILGVELYEPGIGSVLSRLASDKIDNVLVIERPAQEVLAELDEGMVSEIRIFFPDPWPKTRHHKRRLIQPDFVTQLARVMADSAIVRLATDWAPYASRMRRVFAEETTLLSVHDAIRVPGDHSEAGDDEVRGITKFEARGEKLGHEIHDLVYRRKPRE